MALACVMVNVCFPTDETYVVDNAPAALAVFGKRKTELPGAQFTAKTTVEVALAVNVTDPVAFDRPMASCCSDIANLARSFSWLLGTKTPAPLI